MSAFCPLCWGLSAYKITLNAPSHFVSGSSFVSALFGTTPALNIGQTRTEPTVQIRQAVIKLAVKIGQTPIDPTIVISQMPINNLTLAAGLLVGSFAGAGSLFAWPLLSAVLMVRAGVVTYPARSLALLGPSWTHALPHSWLSYLRGHFNAWIRLGFGPFVSAMLLFWRQSPCSID